MSKGTRPPYSGQDCVCAACVGDAGTAATGNAPPEPLNCFTDEDVTPGVNWPPAVARANDALAKLTARVLKDIPTRYGCGAWSDNAIIKKQEADRLVALIGELTAGFDPTRYVLLDRKLLDEQTQSVADSDLADVVAIMERDRQQIRMHAGLEDTV